MMEIDASAFGEPGNLELEIYHRQCGAHAFSLLPIIERIPLEVDEPAKQAPLEAKTPDRAAAQAAQAAQAAEKPVWDPSLVGVQPRRSQMRLSAGGDSPALRLLYDEIDQLRRSSLRDEHAYASRSAANDETSSSLTCLTSLSAVSTCSPRDARRKARREPHTTRRGRERPRWSRAARDGVSHQVLSHAPGRFTGTHSSEDLPPRRSPRCVCCSSPFTSRARSRQNRRTTTARGASRTRWRPSLSSR